MSTKKIKTLTRELSYTATWLAGVLTVTTAQNHYLASTNLVTFIPPIGFHLTKTLPITYVGVNSFTVPLANANDIKSSGMLSIPYFSTGQTGDQSIFSISKTIASPSILQYTAVGTGGAVLVTKVSNDQLGWVTLSTVTLAGSNLATDVVTITSNWEYAKITITSIGAATSVVATIVA